MRHSTRILAIVICACLSMGGWAQEPAKDVDRDQLLSNDRTIVAIEHDSRHLFHLQTKALVAHLGGWARPANEDGSEMDSFTGVSETVIPVNLNRIKARIRRGKVDEATASEFMDIIGIFETAIATGLELADQLDAGQLVEASDTYRIQSTPQYERFWRRTITLIRSIERRL